MIKLSGIHKHIQLGHNKTIPATKATRRPEDLGHDNTVLLPPNSFQILTKYAQLSVNKGSCYLKLWHPSVTGAHSRHNNNLYRLINLNTKSNSDCNLHCARVQCTLKVIHVKYWKVEHEFKLVHKSVQPQKDKAKHITRDDTLETDEWKQIAKKTMRAKKLLPLTG